MFYLEYGINAKPCFETSFQEEKQEINISDIALFMIIICMEVYFCHYLSESNFVVSNYQEKQELRGTLWPIRFTLRKLRNSLPSPGSPLFRTR